MPIEKFKVEVVRDGHDDIFVRVTVTEDGIDIGRALLPGGTEENATAMAQGLIRYADAGGDLTDILPNARTKRLAVRRRSSP